jgi:protein-S-isoprenylcysteine O-methyltransferase Ste14
MNPPVRRSLGRVGDFLIDHRVRFSVAIFGSLFIFNVIMGILPGRLVGPGTIQGASALAIIFTGLALRSWAAGTCQKGKGLTTWGPYRWCRHPLYLGSLLIMAGFALLIPNVMNCAVVIGPVSAIYVLTIVREEQRLAVKYGAAWTAYAGSVPRFLPRSLPGITTGGWSRALWWRRGEYQLVSLTCASLLAFELWHFWASS